MNSGTWVLEVQNMTKDLIALQKAEELFSVPRATIRRWLEEVPQKVYGEKSWKGSRQVWLVSAGSLRRKLEEKQAGSSYSEFEKLWLERLRNGWGKWKSHGVRTIEGREYGIQKYWELCKLPKTFENVNFNTLRDVLGSIQRDDENKSCHFSMKMQIYNSFKSLTEMMAEEGRYDLEMNKNLRSIMPKRFYPAKKECAKSDDVEKLLIANRETFETTKRREFDKVLNEAIILIMYDGGVRVSEVAELKLTDVDLENGMMVVTGKGQKQRLLGINPRMTKALRAWLEIRPKYKSDLVFITAYGGECTRRVIYRRISRLAKHCGVEVNPHSLRRGFGTSLLQEGFSLEEVRNSLGHASVQTTNLYLMSDARLLIQKQKERFKPVTETMPELEVPEDPKPKKIKRLTV